MKNVRRAGCFLGLLAATNGGLIFFLCSGYGAAWRWILCGVLLALFVSINVRPGGGTAPTKRIRRLTAGCELLRLFLATATVNAAWMLLWLPAAIRNSRDGGIFAGLWLAIWLLIAVPMVILEATIFWNGMIRVYITSVQLGIRHRVLAALCGFIPIINLWYLRKIIRITADEAEFETEKWELDDQRAESEVCKTRYPIVLVHGVFFRDFRYVNYWGRIPKELRRNGAELYYGCQQSAASVEDAGKELAERIRAITGETGCEKVNMIAHSKGGLDARAAISHQGCGPLVATLTTINTPHRGCIFAEYLLNRLPDAARQKMAAAYNAALKRLGDTAPDFLAAVTDLTESRCLRRNELTPDAPGVVYESVSSFCARARSGKFPLNVTYPVVRHFDGKNDGLVAVDSARWGSRFTLLTPAGRRGISHGDVIDLNRENIPGFDVREFYVNLVADLKRRGY
ncbi:MAG: triacylglycerol lipase [Oscillibacter sp.]|nr:triacylglycerol lipase [Oscillibacter sp.]